MSNVLGKRSFTCCLWSIFLARFPLCLWDLQVQSHFPCGVMHRTLWMPPSIAQRGLEMVAGGGLLTRGHWDGRARHRAAASQRRRRRRRVPSRARLMRRAARPGPGPPLPPPAPPPGPGRLRRCRLCGEMPGRARGRLSRCRRARATENRSICVDICSGFPPFQRCSLRPEPCN